MILNSHNNSSNKYRNKTKNLFNIKQIAIKQRIKMDLAIVMVNKVIVN